MSTLFEPAQAGSLQLANRIVMAPLTRNRAPGAIPTALMATYYLQRATAGLIVTEATAISHQGQGYADVPGLYAPEQIEGWKRVTAAVHAAGGRIVTQLWHVGRVSHTELQPGGGQPVAPSAVRAKTKTVLIVDGVPTFVDTSEPRALDIAEIPGIVDDYRRAALAAIEAGFDGVEIHGAHGYVLAQFLSPEVNQRTDRWGGSPENRARIVIDILKGVRERCGPDFQLGLRLSPERFGLDLGEIRDLAQRLMTEDLIDYLDMSLWDVRKAPMDEAYKDKSLIRWFTDLDRGDVRLGVAGKVMTPADAEWCLDQGCDFVLIGRGAILHHDWPKLAAADPAFRPISLPVTREHLRAEGLSDRFVTYMQAWKGFVAEEETVPA